MGNPKWNSGVGIARASSISDEPATPKRYLVCESAQIVAVPTVYERQVAFLADIDHVANIGFDYTFQVDGIQPTVTDAAYLFWLALGSNNYAAGTHQITPATASQYLNLFLDYQMDIEAGAGTDPVARLIGGKITSLVFEQPYKALAKMSIGGVGATLGTPLASITPSVETGDDEEPLGWKHLQNTIGTNSLVKVALNGAAFANDHTVQGFKFEYQRNAILSGQSVGGNQPTKIDNGIRTVNFSITKEFAGTDAEGQIAAFLQQQKIGFEVKYYVGSLPGTLLLHADRGSFTGNILPTVGQEEDVLKLEITGRAYKASVTPVFYCYAMDDEGAAYT